MFKEIVFYRCSLCYRTYEEKPDECTCRRSFKVNQRISSFIVLGKIDKFKLLAKCLFCGLTIEIRTSNIRKQLSCGCKPKHIDVLSINDAMIQYLCKKCEKVNIENLPIIEYCCED